MAEATKSESKAVKFTPDEVIAKQRNRQLMIMTVIIVVLSGLVWLASRSQKAEAPLEKIMLVGGTDEEPAIEPKDVQRILIWKGKADPFELTRVGDQWRVPSRFNAPADKADVESLLTRITDSQRLSRASTTTEAQYINYGLNDEDAVHVRLVGDNGKELLHFLIGRSETGSRDFVRLVGEDAPPGIFELAGLGGTFDTLYGALNLDSNGEPKGSRWISTAAFEPLPFLAVAQEITLRDGERSLTFTRRPGSDPGAEEWLLTAPRKGDADGSAVRSIVDALQNYRADDIAGRDTDAVKLGVAAAERELSVSYTLDSEKIHTTRLYFGNRGETGKIAVWFKTEDKGEFIWWAPDYVLSRIFRATPELMRKSRLNLVPDGTDADNLTIDDHGTALKLIRDGGAWKLAEPWANDAERTEVSNLLTGLSTLQGYPVSDTIDRVALELGPGNSTRSITAAYTDKKAGEPVVKTAVLYFGKTQQGELPVMRVVDGVEVIYWVQADAAAKLFQPPINYLKLGDVSILGRGQTPNEIRVQGGETVLQLTKTAADGEEKQWKILEPWDEVADQSEADGLLRAITSLRAVKQAEPLDKELYKLGPGLSTRRIDMRSGEPDVAKTTQLFIGEPKDGLLTALVVKPDAAEEFWLFRTNDLYPLFLSPADYRVLAPFSGKVRHILVSWKGRYPGVNPKDPNRTEAEARALANSLMERANKGEDFVTLQEEFNEDDSDPTHVYDVSPTESLVKPFLRLSSHLEVGKTGVVESQFGLHVIKRIE